MKSHNIYKYVVTMTGRLPVLNVGVIICAKIPVSPSRGPFPKHSRLWVRPGGWLQPRLHGQAGLHVCAGKLVKRICGCRSPSSYSRISWPT